MRPSARLLLLAVMLCGLATAALTWVGGRRLVGPGPALAALALLIAAASFSITALGVFAGASTPIAGG